MISTHNLRARISPKGDVKLFQIASGCVATGVSPDEGTLLTAGGLLSTVTPVAAMKPATGKLGRLHGASETLIGSLSATTGAGASYGGTTAYRVTRFGADGKVVKATPVK